MNTYLVTLVRAANAPQTATWDAEWNRLLTAKPDWT
jgi:hypothetical protein